MIVFINGSIVVDTDSSTALERVREFLGSAPKIVSEELDCEFFLNQPSGTNVYDADGEEYQTLVTITVFGRLRYVTFGGVVEQYEAFFDALQKRFWVDLHNVEIADCYCTEVRRFNSVSQY